LALPVALSRNRFFVPLWVFCFGIVPILYPDSSVYAKPPILELPGRLAKGVSRDSVNFTCLKILILCHSSIR
jgi:hypothetical protein